MQLVKGKLLIYDSSALTILESGVCF